jgi:hypothetical protein
MVIISYNSNLGDGGRRPSRSRFSIVFALASFVIFGILVSVYFGMIRDAVDPTWTDANVSASLATGDKIVAALERYRSRSGHYPSKLEELIPTELTSVIPPAAGDGKWAYASNGPAYGLSFNSSVPGTSWNIHSRHPHWWLISRSQHF